MAIINKGEILLKQDPKKSLDFYKGRIWEKEISKTEMDEYSSKYFVISSRLFGGQNFIKVLSDTKPEEGFKKVEPILEDVYFHTLAKHNEILN